MTRPGLWPKLTILSWVLGVAVCAGAGRVGAAPVVFWASDPIRPGETVMATGEGFGGKPSVEVWRLNDGLAGTPDAKAPVGPGQTEKAKVVQPGDKSLKFVVPGSLRPGVYGYRVSAGGVSTQGMLNRPVVWWVLGDGGTFATPGGSVRVLGKNLTRPGQERGNAALLLKGPRSVLLTAAADCYMGRCALPKDLPTGAYQLLVHNGCGGAAGWSEAITLRVERPKPWPARVFNVRDFGADATGATDATEAVQAALLAAGKNGGGVVFFPRGRYQVNRTLIVPRFTVLRGERREWVNVFWPDMQQPPPVLITGTNSFGLEDLTLYCGNYKTFLTADTKGEGAGDVFLRRLCVRADLYRGHITPEEVDRRYRGGLGGFGGGYWLAVLG
ncbi:MAG: glycosyl hydrolase family 28-related protein, partial [Armatimonadota bacterium]